MAAVGLPMLLSPSLVLWVLSPEPHAMTPFESYLCRTLSFALFLSAFMVLLCSGSIRNLYGGDGQADSLPSDSSPLATITLVSTLMYHFAVGVLLWTYSYEPGLSSSLMTLGFVGHLVLGVAGLLIVVFRGDSKISKRTGADKRTSGFPFKNAEAARKHR